MIAIGKCPWCGGEGNAPDILGVFHVQCQKCGACGPISPREDGAITAWNRVATPDPAEVRGRVLWGVPYTAGPSTAFLGRKSVGSVRQHHNGGWSWSSAWCDREDHANTLEAARAALVAAVREAIQTEETT